MKLIANASRSSRTAEVSVDWRVMTPNQISSSSGLSGMTSADKIAVRGASNGGLLVAAAVTQFPDLFKVGLCGVPLVDMLRYHKFGSGKTWIEEYGSADDPADFPSIFYQKPREGMHLHWDGNNDSLAERNLSAAIGAGVTEKSVDHASVERIAAWLGNLRPLPSPNRPDAAKVSSGRTIYMAQCAACHGKKEGALLGTIVYEVPIK